MSTSTFEEVVQAATQEYCEKFSDIHLSLGRTPLVRQYADLKPISSIGPITHEFFDGFLAERAELYAANKHRALDDDFAVSFSGTRWRVNSSVSLHGRTIITRRIPKDIPFIGDLGVPEYLKEVINKNAGIFLICGATGSGKTTTLAAMLELLNRTRAVKIITLENPVEFVYESKMADIIQREIGSNTPSFASGIRSAMRQDPDVVLVGEIRDKETAEAALELAETGHLVFATIHAEKTIGAVDRLMGLFKNDSNQSMRLASLSSSLIAVMAQKLVPKRETGLVLASELLIVTQGVRSCISEGQAAKASHILETSASMGMYTLNNSLTRLVTSGQITHETAKEYSYDPSTLLI